MQALASPQGGQFRQQVTLPAGANGLDEAQGQPGTEYPTGQRGPISDTRNAATAVKLSTSTR